MKNGRGADWTWVHIGRDFRMDGGCRIDGVQNGRDTGQGCRLDGVQT